MASIWNDQDTWIIPDVEDAMNNSVINETQVNYIANQGNPDVITNLVDKEKKVLNQYFQNNDGQDGQKENLHAGLTGKVNGAELNHKSC